MHALSSLPHAACAQKEIRHPSWGGEYNLVEGPSYRWTELFKGKGTRDVRLCGPRKLRILPSNEVYSGGVPRTLRHGRSLSLGELPPHVLFASTGWSPVFSLPPLAPAPCLVYPSLPVSLHPNTRCLRGTITGKNGLGGDRGCI